MSYIGNTATQQEFTPAIDYFSGNGSTVAFTLSRPVASVAQVQVVVNNVPQNPGTAFTVLNSTITFTGAPSSGTNNVYVQYTSPITQIMQPGQGTVGNTQMASGAALANIGAGGVTQSYFGSNVASNGPAFSAYASSNQSVSSATSTKVIFDVETFDTNSNFASSRFTPTVAGYYQFTAGVSSLTASSTNPWFLSLSRNGGQTQVSGYFYPLVTGVIQISGLLYLNGSTDYVEIYAYQGGMSQTIFGRSDQTYFQGFLARAA